MVLPNRIFTIAEAANCGLDRGTLARLVARGELERVSRGLYAPVGYAGDGHIELETLAARGGKFIVALESALQLHGFTSVSPHELCIAVPKGARQPAVDIPLRVIHVDERFFDVGTIERDVAGTKVRVYNPARTISDMFKFRRTLGMEVVLNSLKEACSRKIVGVDELMLWGEINRVGKVMLPYIEGCFI